MYLVLLLMKKTSDIWNLTLKTLAPIKMYFYTHYGEFTRTPSAEKQEYVEIL